MFEPKYDRGTVLNGTNLRCFWVNFFDWFFVAERVHSERSAFILSAAGMRTFCPAWLVEKAGCERGGLGFKQDEDF